MPVKLSKKIVEALQPPPGKAQETFWDSDLKGFGLRVGKHRKTFIFEGKVSGTQVKRKVTIGVLGRLRPDGHAWNVRFARDRAKAIQGQLAAGVDPAAKAPKTGGPTLRDALELHLRNMEKKNRSPRSIKTVRQGIEKHLADWLDRPIVELDSIELDAIHDRIIANAKPIAGAVNPPGQALAKRIVVNVGSLWNSLNKKHQGKLGGWNPARGVETHSLAAREARLSGEAADDMDLAEWYGKVMTLAPVRRDLQLFTLFSAIRSEGVRNIRWEDISDRVLHVRIAKGDRPYKIPLVETHLKILERRAEENKLEFGNRGGDHGWVFPTISRDAQRVQPVSEPKQWQVVDGERVKYLPGLHVLRRTWNSIGAEIGVDPFTRNVLMNHKIPGVNAEHYTVINDLKRFAAAQVAIEKALWARLKTKKNEGDQ